MDRLLPLILFLKGPLHIEVKLALTLDALLFHITDNPLMHGLPQDALVSVTKITKERKTKSVTYGSFCLLMIVNNSDGANRKGSGECQSYLRCSRHVEYRTAKRLLEDVEWRV